ncbi:endonuclease/exonuclease/phosphatase family protein [Saccharopolyspora gloriosae]|uniref:endonuclease/exonuclease/phosphatase family protein n=1 Tax=Saccharopolyspora gloriosae TaxID=455344 RepID=UPI001FB5CB50|nr:endonuclease/exonuclease/phosphatase family protein [Saccharopolyspora gloriosae]
MNRRFTTLATAAVVVTSTALAAPAADAEQAPATAHDVRFATFNASLNRSTAGELLADLSTPDDLQAAEVAEVVQRSRPDVLLLNEFDHVEGGAAVDAFRDNYLAVGHHGAAPIDYPYSYTAPVNTGVPSGMDLDNDGTVGGPGDAHGFGEFPGQYGMVVLSKHPINEGEVRTFQQFRWADMPGALLPDDPATPEPADWFSPEELKSVRLSSKSHWDVPVEVGGREVHLLAAHPTPPNFDGPEDRNGLRNNDEIRFWSDYVHPARGRYLYDDTGRRGGLASGARFVIAGDHNSDPADGDSVPGAAKRLLTAHRVHDPEPASAGAAEAARDQGGANTGHHGPARLDTADFSDDTPGNLRVDYVLPSWPLRPTDAGVFWPTAEDEASRLNDASDHHLTWVDLRA